MCAPSRAMASKFPILNSAGLGMPLVSSTLLFVCKFGTLQTFAKFRLGTNYWFSITTSNLIPLGPSSCSLVSSIRSRTFSSFGKGCPSRVALNYLALRLFPITLLFKFINLISFFNLKIKYMASRKGLEFLQSDSLLAAGVALYCLDKVVSFDPGQ